MAWFIPPVSPFGRILTALGFVRVVYILAAVSHVSYSIENLSLLCCDIQHFRFDLSPIRSIYRYAIQAFSDIIEAHVRCKIERSTWSWTMDVIFRQVRGVASPSGDLVLSVSRDTSAISWRRESPSSFTPESIIQASSRFVNAVAFLPPTPQAPRGMRHRPHSTSEVDCLP